MKTEIWWLMALVMGWFNSGLHPDCGPLAWREHPSQFDWRKYTIYYAYPGNGDGLFPWVIDGELVPATPEWAGVMVACTPWEFGRSWHSQLLGRQVLCGDNLGIPPVQTVGCEVGTGWWAWVDVFWLEEMDTPWWSGGLFWEGGQ